MAGYETGSDWVRDGILKMGQAQTFLGKRGNMECVKGKARKMGE
jgi:hypothetical protein